MLTLKYIIMRNNIIFINWSLSFHRPLLFSLSLRFTWSFSCTIALIRSLLSHIFSPSPLLPTTSSFYYFSIYFFVSLPLVMDCLPLCHRSLFFLRSFSYYQLFLLLYLCFLSKYYSNYHHLRKLYLCRHSCLKNFIFIL